MRCPELSYCCHAPVSVEGDTAPSFRCHSCGQPCNLVFNPDWTITPAATLREWMKQKNVTRGALARQCGRGLAADLKASLIIAGVLSREPLLESHAEMLERGTGVPARLWLNLERNYRADLDAGRADTTPEDDDDRQ